MAFLFSFHCDSPDQGSAKSRCGKLVCRRRRTLAKQSGISTIFLILFLGPRLADTFNNESVIDCPLLSVLRDTLVCFAIVPIFRRLYVREFCYHDSLNGIALQDFVLPISHQDFNWMSFHCRFNSGPISLKLLLIQCFCSSENDVSGHDCSPFMG